MLYCTVYVTFPLPNKVYLETFKQMLIREPLIYLQQHSPCDCLPCSKPNLSTFIIDVQYSTCIIYANSRAKSELFTINYIFSICLTGIMMGF